MAHRLKGRLKVATGSLTFDPEAPDAPIVRIILRDVLVPPAACVDDASGSSFEMAVSAVRPQ